MGLARWPAERDGRYWLDIALGNHALRLMIDLGLVDPHHWVGFELEPSVYDQLKAAGQIVFPSLRSRRDATGNSATLESGMTNAQLLEPVGRQRVGPRVTTAALRSFHNVPSRVGIAFFHRLTGCRVLWQLDSRQWCIEFP